ncbi:hypothetical protein Glove_300g38 [Diversispora epigaea]|uniref:Uncharacterized protein n=1 Tax=Diversispora epigaea TaxID=1348612 RepID=A0A397I2L3_9GLOM|nr:hypothetical protein Glove_300g38 [Diversispora epigaea]
MLPTTETCDNGGNCYPKLLEATEEFKEILGGQECLEVDDDDETFSQVNTGYYSLPIIQKKPQPQPLPLPQCHKEKTNLILHLLNSLSSEEGNDIKVLSRLLYALSSIVRGNKAAMKIVNENDGLSLLAILCKKLEDDEVRVKCALFITDFIDPNMVAKAGESDDVILYDLGVNYFNLLQLIILVIMTNYDDDDDDIINNEKLPELA